MILLFSFQHTHPTCSYLFYPPLIPFESPLLLLQTTDLPPFFLPAISISRLRVLPW